MRSMSVAYVGILDIRVIVAVLEDDHVRACFNALIEISKGGIDDRTAASGVSRTARQRQNGDHRSKEPIWQHSHRVQV